jgi:hypothetical protein
VHQFYAKRTDTRSEILKVPHKQTEG